MKEQMQSMKDSSVILNFNFNIQYERVGTHRKLVAYVVLCRSEQFQCDSLVVEENSSQMENFVSASSKKVFHHKGPNYCNSLNIHIHVKARCKMLSRRLVIQRNVIGELFAPQINLPLQPPDRHNVGSWTLEALYSKWRPVCRCYWMEGFLWTNLKRCSVL